MSIRRLSISTLAATGMLLAANIAMTALTASSAFAGFNCNNAVKFVSMYGKVWGVDRLGRYHLCGRSARQ
jgi:hypothetical protein